MKRSTNASKLDQIKSGGITKKQIGGNATQKTFQSKGGKFTITETSKKFEEAGVAKKKRNYVMFQSKLGTEKEQNLTMHQQPSVKPRNNEKIIQTKKKVEYLDNYQYHETKNIKDNDPNKVSVVTHRRKGDIVGGSYETKTFQKQSMTDSGRGNKLYSSQTTKTTTRKNVAGKPTTTTTTIMQRANTASKTLPSQSKSQKTEIKKFSTNTNLRGAPKKPAPAPKPAAKTTTTKPATKTTTTKTTTKTTTTKPATKTTTTKTTTKTITTKTTTKTSKPSAPRAQSAGSGRRH